MLGKTLEKYLNYDIIFLQTIYGDELASTGCVCRGMYAVWWHVKHIVPCRTLNKRKQ